MDKTTLTKYYGVTFRRTTPVEIEISIPDWTLRRVRNHLRVIRQSEHFAIATPGRCGNFNSSYQYQFHFPLEGCGVVSIEKMIRELHYGFHEFRASDVMVEITASAINEAKKMLRN